MKKKKHTKKKLQNESDMLYEGLVYINHLTDYKNNTHSLVWSVLYVALYVMRTHFRKMGHSSRNFQLFAHLYPYCDNKRLLYINTDLKAFA